MVALLGDMRRERNGAVADSMRFVGKGYGLNYGVSLPTVRQLARAEGSDDGFARYLYRQEVRELHLAALHIADPERLTIADAGFWADGIYNSEVAEEAAFALLSRAAIFPDIFSQWIDLSGSPILQYAALMAASRFAEPQLAWARRAVGLVLAADATLQPHEARMVARGAVALCVAVGLQNEENRQAIFCAIGSPVKLPAAEYLHEELTWQLNAG